MEAGIGRSYLSGVERALCNTSLISITKLAIALSIEPYFGFCSAREAALVIGSRCLASE